MTSGGLVMESGPEDMSNLLSQMWHIMFYGGLCIGLVCVFVKKRCSAETVDKIQACRKYYLFIMIGLAIFGGLLFVLPG
tara:strand:- start:101 stop:337 length:237 start_codon:yes stop_codon:yes gene_type:complete